MYIGMDTIVTLHEYFNTSNQTSPHFERHESFVTDEMEDECALVGKLQREKRCEYLLSKHPCTQMFLINYYELLYCHIGSETIWKVAAFILIVFAVLSYLYVIMTSTSSKFFCPSISVFAHLLGLSENVAGVTLLAFANGVNDFLAGIASVDRETRLHYNDTLASNLCLLNIVAGSLLFIQPFIMQPYTFLRDTCVLLLYVAAIDLFYKSDDVITLTEGILLILIYIFYITVVIAEHFLVKEKKRRYKPDELRGSLSTTLYLKKYSPLVIKTKKLHEIIDVSSPLGSFDTIYSRNHNLWLHLWEGLNPIDCKIWKTKNWIGRILDILRIPHTFLLNLFIPVVDYEERRRGWSKLLNCLQIIILPFGVGYLLPKIAYGFLLNTLFVSIPLSVYIFYTTRTHITPYHHTYMAILTITGAIAVSYTCAMEVLSLFDAIGIISGSGSTFLGATLLAWSNCFFDLLTTIILAQQGYVEMGFAGCFGGAIYNCMVSLSFFVIYGAYKSPDLEEHFPEGTTGETVGVFLILSLLLLLLGASTTNFHLRRSLAIFLFIMYAIFVTFALMGEMEIVHSYGTDHKFDMKMALDDFNPGSDDSYDYTDLGEDIH